VWEQPVAAGMGDLFDKLYAPLAAGILQPFTADERIPTPKITALDRRYTAVLGPR
jgi:hypothetical protein